MYFMPPGNDDNFTPKLGRPRDLGHRSSKRYVTRVLNAAGKINPHFGKRSRKSAYTGRNIGRGNHANAFITRDAKTRFRQRRVVIKARFVKLAGSGFRKAAAHVHYVQRDGVSKDGETGKLYNAVLDDVDSDKFLERSREDRHQFRFIVSPEDAGELEDMNVYTRDLMDQMERDLGTKLDWVAVDHYNTDNPHIHIIVRGVDDKGKDLVIARNYLSAGIRERASKLMTDELGPRQDHEIQRAMRQNINQDRFTSIDRNLIRQAEDGIVDMRGVPQSPYEKFRRGLDLARLEKLEVMGLANQFSPGK